MTGTIKKKTDRGFGFISIAGQDKDLFFHSSELVGVAFDSISEGASVTFDVVDGSDGRQSAKNIKLADAGSENTAMEKREPEEVEPEEVEPEASVDEATESDEKEADEESEAPEEESQSS